MSNYKPNPKMKSDLPCFKEGGSVYKSRMHKEDPQELAEDKAMVKKGIRQHETAKHKGEEKTEIKLKKGGRCKREGGVVNKFKTGGVVGANGKGGKEDPIKKVKDTSGKAEAPSAAKGKKKDPSTNFKKGGWFNEEPDDMTAPPPKKAAPKKSFSYTNPATKEKVEIPPLPLTKPGKNFRIEPLPPAKPNKNWRSEVIPAQGERDAIMQMFQGGPGQGAISDYERSLMENPQGYAFGGSVSDIVPQAGMAGLGTALDTGALGGAAPIGAARNAPMTPQEQDVIRGLQAIGSYCRGGKV